MSSPAVIRFADCELDLSAFELRRDGRPQPIEPQVFELLAYLLAHPGRLVGRDELIDKVWGGRAISDAALSSRIKSARRAIGDDGERQVLIRTVHGRGFRFVGEVVASIEPKSPVTNQENPDGDAETVRGAMSRRGLAVALSALFLAGLAVLWPSLISPPSSSGSSPGIAPGAVAPPFSIAVMPFTEPPGEARSDAFAERLVEAMTTRLTRMSTLFVMARGTAFAYKGKPLEPRAVGRELNVRYVVLGSMRLADRDTHIHVELIEAERGTALWAQHLHFAESDEPTTPERLASRLAQSVEARIIAAENARHLREAPEDDSPDSLALRGYAIINKRVTRDKNEEAFQLFEAALARDREHIAALLGYARTALNKVLNHWSAPSERADWLGRVDDALLRAITLIPSSPSAHRIRGSMLRARNEPEQAIAAFEHVIDLDPNDAAAHAELGRTKIDVGLASETIGHVEQAIRINPSHRDVVFWYFWAGQAAVHLGDGEKALHWLRRAIEVNPSYRNPVPWLVVAYGYLERDEEARRYLDQFTLARGQITISDWGAAYRRANPVVRVQLERMYAVLRRLGVPE